MKLYYCCKYCQKDCLVDFSDGLLYGERVDVKKWKCHTCMIIFRSYAYDRAKSEIWAIKLGEESYTVRFWVMGEVSKATVLRALTAVLRLDFIPPDWHPNNIQDKLQLYLPLL